MIEEKRIAVVVPAYNEEQKIFKVLETVPAVVDAVYVVNDCSKDGTAEVVRRCAERDARIVLIEQEKNGGVGAAIVRGYEAAIENGDDIAVVMAGDGQMDPADLPALLRPVLADQCDYAKGNRFLRGREEIGKIPIQRLFGNLILSALTKIASGYWHVSDSQGGYTAINRRALMAVDWSKCYPRYGCPNDYLVRLNIANMRVAEVSVAAIYGANWSSSMVPYKVGLPILMLLWRLFWTRMFRKYVVINGHPLVLFYVATMLGFVLTVVLFGYILWGYFATGRIPQTATIIMGMSGMMTLQFLLNGFAMDYRDNEWLCIHQRP